ncbi:DUF3099 domain-containing protein [Streptodolium elevatio]|uniref:DUF3099 domain-containing protein n=1 Tax=Streptodolium elevatio TaxID=3157996 RepID=A0ABV3D9Z9_9ACTN
MVLVNRAGRAETYQISGARKGLTEDVRGRQRRYVVSMSIRTVCFILAVVLEGPLRWVMIAGALLLPYVAVVVANAGRSRRLDPPPASQVVPPQAHRAIEPPPHAVLTSAERHDITVVPEDAWIVPDEAAAPPRGTTVWATTASGETSAGKAPGSGAGEPHREPSGGAGGGPDAPPEGNRQ